LADSLVAVVFCLLLGASIVGLWSTRRTYPALLVMLAAVLVGTVLRALFPGGNQQTHWAVVEALYAGLDLLVLVELVARVTPPRSRSRALARFLLTLVALNLVAAAYLPTAYSTSSAAHAVMVLIRIDVVLALGLLATLGLVAWHLLILSSLDEALLVGLAASRLAHAIGLWLWFSPGSYSRGYLFTALDIIVLGWLAWRAWVPGRAYTPPPLPQPSPQ
jgi:hypothetical protein